MKEDSQIWTFVDVIKAFFGCYIFVLFVFGMLAWIFHIDVQNWYFLFFNNVLFFVILTIVILSTIVYRHNIDLKTGLAIYQVNVSTLMLSVLIGILFVVIAKLIMPTIFRPTTNDITIPPSNIALVLDLIAGILIYPICEEIFWRGFAFAAVERRMNKIGTVLFIAILSFGIHVPALWGAWSALANIFLVCIVLSSMRSLTKSIIPSIITHFVYNTGVSIYAIVITYMNIK